MTTTTRSLAASSPPTPTFEVAGASGPAAASATTSNVVIFNFEASRTPPQPIPARHKTVDEIVERWSRDEGRRKALENGRRWLARTVLSSDGDTIRNLRLRKGWSQSQLASELATSQSHVARIERGTENLSLDTCRRLCAALGVDMNSLDAALLRQESLRGKGEAK